MIPPGAALLTAGAAWLAAILSGATASPTPASAPPIALHPGDHISDRQLFAYLSFGVHPGDWVEYRVDLAGGLTAIKTIGFGVETVAGSPTLFIETHVRALPVMGLPASSTIGIGTDAVLKTYVSATTFGDLDTPYHIVTTALEVGEFAYEVKPATDETYTALAGDVYEPARMGTIRSVEPVDLRVGAATVHTTHVVATFEALPLPVGGVSAGYTLEVWQSPELPAGTVQIASPGMRTVHWRCTAFGRGYRSLFRRSLDEIRSGAQPSAP